MYRQIVRRTGGSRRLLQPPCGRPSSTYGRFSRRPRLLSSFESGGDQSTNSADSLLGERTETTTSSRYHRRPTSVSIGDVTQRIHHHDSSNDHSGLVPVGYLQVGDSLSPSSTSLSHLQWMMKKSLLGQDMLLVGTPSTSIYRRHLVMMYAELMQRPIQFLTIHQDLTESDLKQRRELCSGSTTTANSTSIQFMNQAPVEAAIHGHLLLLDGLERAERNVLPTLNNLLENREMPLEDGRFLVSARRYQQHHHDSERFLPVHPNFGVIALSSVPPRQKQQPLDPPLRSRFQIRRIDDEIPSLPSLNRASNVIEQQQQQQQWLQLDATMKSALEQQLLDEDSTMGDTVAWSIPSNHWKSIFRIGSTFGSDDDYDAVLLPALNRSYPVGFRWQEQGNGSTHLMLPGQEGSNRLFKDACRQWNLPFKTLRDDDEQATSHAYVWDDIERINDMTARITFRNSDHKDTVSVISNCGDTTNSLLGTLPKDFIDTESSSLVLTEMLQEHSVGNCDMLLLGGKGEGKTTMATAFCHLLGYTTPHRLSCTKEMTVRDLYQRRRQQQQHDNNDRGWDDSPLTIAMKEGNVCLLEDVQQLSSPAAETMVAALQTLIVDREVTLPDGTRMVREDRYKEYVKKQKQQQLSGEISNTATKIQPIRPSFRLLALATTSSSAKSSKQQQQSWWSEEVMGMFKTVQLPTTLSNQDWMKLLLNDNNSAKPNAPKQVARLLKLRRALEKDPSIALECGIQAPLSMRNMMRTLNSYNHQKYDDDEDYSLYEAICKTLVADLLPPKPQREALDALLKRCGIKRSRKMTKGWFSSSKAKDIVLHVDDTLQIGDLHFRRFPSQNPELVPDPTPFFDIPHHVDSIQRLLQEWMVGDSINKEGAFLLVGNQGVGKNKLVDRALQLANMEREYLQLHRDSTIGQITLSPSLEDGQIIWKDSPLVRAVLHGRALVVDEADKAPMEVVHVLKGLVQDGYLLLADGRMIVRDEEVKSKNDDDAKKKNIIPIHPNFTLWVLANRPGIPFHGNDFFRELGDCFSTHVVSNPDLQSEIALLESYSPSSNVGKERIESIARAFGALRTMSDHGELGLSYPYSTREAVAIVKHLEQFPHDDLTETLFNVLDMDSLLDPHVYSTILNVFRKHGFPVNENAVAGARRTITASSAGSQNQQPLSIEYHHDGGSEGTSNSPPKLSSPKLGKWDDKNEAHVGGNQWSGGTGGSDTAGLGGRGGPYRLDRGHKVHQVSDEAKAQVSKEAQAAARAMAKEALQKRLEEIGMSEMEYDMYQEFVKPMQTEIASLRTHIESSLEAKRNTERSWIKRQSYGEMDDSKIMDGVAGDKYIYKRRGILEDRPSSSQPLKNPKRIRFVMDCSGSMYRFNGYDQRLQRSLEAAALIMEALDGHDLVEYSLVGHSGDSPCIPFVKFGKPPKSELQKMRILQGMMAHTQYCQSGDYTLEAIEQAMKDVQPTTSQQEVDECIVIAISDANLARYGIHPRELGQLVQQESSRDSHEVVSAYCIFIASLGQEAEDIRQALPVGRGHVCMDTKQLPGVVRSILSTKL